MKKSKIEKISYSSSGELVIKFEGQVEEKKPESQLSKKTCLGQLDHHVALDFFFFLGAWMTQVWKVDFDL